MRLTAVRSVFHNNFGSSCANGHSVRLPHAFHPKKTNPGIQPRCLPASPCRLKQVVSNEKRHLQRNAVGRGRAQPAKLQRLPHRADEAVGPSLCLHFLRLTLGAEIVFIVFSRVVVGDEEACFRRSGCTPWLQRRFAFRRRRRDFHSSTLQEGSGAGRVFQSCSSK